MWVMAVRVRASGIRGLPRVRDSAQGWRYMFGWDWGLSSMQEMLGNQVEGLGVQGLEGQSKVFRSSVGLSLERQGWGWVR